MSSPSAICDHTWGCDHFDVSAVSLGTAYVCRVSIHDLSKLALELTKLVVDTSWMLDLDAGTQRAYKQTVNETAKLLVEIFTALDPSGAISDDFGEVMVSLGSARALEMVFSHKTIPLAELWKPQLKQNEGFDFHTECKTPLINFGESKYSAKKSPYGLALDQIDAFITATKHLRDRVHLVNICSKDSIASLDSDQFGVVAAFSLNALDQTKVLSNARDKAIALAKKHGIQQVFIVGVSYEAN